MNLRELFEVEYSEEPEMLDHPEQCSRDEIVGCLPPIEFMNRWTGGRRVLLRHAMPMVQRANAAIVKQAAADSGTGSVDGVNHAGRRPVTVLDIGTGGGDMPRALVDACRAKKIPVSVRAIDMNRDIVAWANERSDGYPEIAYGVSDVFAMRAEPESYDVVMASLFFHHFSPEQCVALFNLMGRLARYGLVVSDGIRHPMAMLAVRCAAAFVRSPVFRYDAIASVRRTFTVEEWADIARRTVLPDIRLWTHVPYRVAITWERSVVSARERRPVREASLIDPDLVTPAPVAPVGVV